MATSDVQIANYALTLLGKNRINDFSEDNEAARAVNAVYSLVRDACLSEHEWSFAVLRSQLGQLSDTPEFDWGFQFALPDDCLRVIATDLGTGFVGVGLVSSLNGSGWQIEGRTLVCNSENVKIKYISQVTDPTKFSPMFVKYFSTRLAEELAFPLTGSRVLEGDLYQKAEKIKMNAYGIDSVEGTPDDLTNDEWRSGRY